MTDKFINKNGDISDDETEALKPKDDWYPWDEARDYPMIPEHTIDEFDPGCLAIEKRRPIPSPPLSDDLRPPNLCEEKYTDDPSKGFPPDSKFLESPGTECGKTDPTPGSPPDDLTELPDSGKS